MGDDEGVNIGEDTLQARKAPGEWEGINTSPFVDLEALCLRRSQRSGKLMEPISLINKMTTLAFTVLVTPVTLSVETTSYYY